MRRQPSNHPTHTSRSKRVTAKVDRAGDNPRLHGGYTTLPYDQSVAPSDKLELGTRIAGIHALLDAASYASRNGSHTIAQVRLNAARRELDELARWHTTTLPMETP